MSQESKEKAMAFMKSVAQRSGDPFYVANPADGFRFVYVNEAACVHFGRSREEMLNLSLFDVDPFFPARQWPSLWEELKEKGAMFFETVHRHANGREIPVAVSANLFAQEGKELFGGCIHDLREQRRSEDALKESEERLRVIFNSTYDAILVHTPDGAILDVNEPFLRMHGLSREQALGLRIDDLSSPSMSMETARSIWAKVLAGEPQLFEWKGRRYRNGEEFEAEVFLRKVRLEGRDAILANVRDITERKRAEEALIEARKTAEAASRAKDHFLANMSHELRTPMTVIMSVLEFLVDSNPTPQQLRLMEMADTSSRRLLEIIEDLLDISRIETGRLLVKERPFDLRECVREAAEMFTVSAQRKGLLLAWDVESQVPERVIGDPDRVRQLLVNLIGNAVKFTARGNVTVAVAVVNERMVFTVRDTGIGIDAARLNEIFEPFTQVDTSSTRRFGGTGLGLTICRELVELMGGGIRATSEVGKGSVFSFVLPLKEAGAQEPEPATDSMEVKEEARERGGRILLVEDESAVREMIRMILEQGGWTAEPAESGEEAVEKWQAGAFDLILMDVQMPGMDGLDATRLIRKMEEGREERTCIVALTAHAGQKTKEECLEAGMDGFLPKPVKIAELYEAIDRCLDRKR